MSPKKLVLLLVIAVAGIAALIKLNSSPSSVLVETADAQEDSKPLADSLNQSAIANKQPTLLEGDFAQLKHLTLHRAIDLSMCKLVPAENEQWNLLEPIVDRAEAGLAATLANHLFDTAKQPVPEVWRNRAREDLGLAAPRLSLEALFQNGDEEHLQIGAEVPGSPYHFALHEQEVVLVPKQLVELIQRAPDLWRDHGIVRWPHLVRRLEWSPAKGEGFIMERTGNQWMLLQPIQGAVDPMRMNSLLRMLGTRVNALPGDRLSQESRDQFEENAGTLALYNQTTKSGSPPQSYLVQGPYAIDANREFLLALSPGDFRFLDYSAEELRSRRLEDFDPNHISSIRLILDSEETILTRGRTGWANADGRRLNSNGQQQMTSLLRYLSILETKQLAKPSNDLQVQSILLSQARMPVPRGATQFRYSVMPDGNTAISAAGSHQSYLADRNLDEEWRKALVYEP